ncbi:hypothetical protein [Paucibacter sp. DJ2R-2]|uniref:hypothetical protein n=1 Tax=Paucibacter sp. DJ2R-2 TaxID=2893558 RepID=UPI0021E4B6EC|nr:hypothetical protein [Paucibacter sp. DJ2R-2]MCV2420236.1 hypothetical protein [Paucibacter sp. DJ4R-1]MCV2436819.1 hypothetical protein [Paucibacter sp. DJ2R-2]
MNLATTSQKIWLCAILTLLSFVVLWCTYRAIRQTNEAASTEHGVSWTMPSGVSLRAGPANLRYDPEQKLLLHRGPLDAAEQLRLRDLLEIDAPAHAAAIPPAPAAPAASGRTARAGVAPASGTAHAVQAGAASSASAPTSAAISSDVTKSYHAAINSLAYKAQESQAEQMQLLIWLGMLGGMLGAMLRSFVDFVGNACYKRELDLVQWWPLYATRPVVGAILGLLLVVMFKAKLISGADTQIVNDSYWWLGMTALGGFSTIDVTARLRQAAKALFGGNN